MYFTDSLLALSRRLQHRHIAFHDRIPTKHERRKLQDQALYKQVIFYMRALARCFTVVVLTSTRQPGSRILVSIHIICLNKIRYMNFNNSLPEDGRLKPKHVKGTQHILLCSVYFVLIWLICYYYYYYYCYYYYYYYYV
jgi:hypothetical protein